MNRGRRARNLHKAFQERMEEIGKSRTPSRSSANAAEFMPCAPSSMAAIRSFEEGDGPCPKGNVQLSGRDGLAQPQQEYLVWVWCRA